MLQIGDRVFEVDKQRSEFSAYIPQEPPGQQSPGRLSWSLEIRCVDKEDDADKEGDLGFSTPYLETHDVTFDVRDWRKIEGQTIRNRDVAPWNPVGAGYKPAPMMAWRRAKIAKLNDATLFKQQGPTAYLYTPEPLRTSGDSIFFASRRGNLFTVEWECSAGVCWDVDHSSDLPLRLNTELAFNGVHIWWVKADAQGLAIVKELVGRNFDLACLEEPQIAGPSHIVFAPRF